MYLLSDAVYYWLSVCTDKTDNTDSEKKYCSFKAATVPLKSVKL